MDKLTPAQARKAFYKAAAMIEAEPNRYKFSCVRVRDSAFGCASCMWGFVGEALGFPQDSHIFKVTDAVGFKETDLYELAIASRVLLVVRAKDASAILRAFADKHWPDTAPAVTPVLTETAMTFDALMASLREPSNV